MNVVDAVVAEVHASDAIDLLVWVIVLAVVVALAIALIRALRGL